MAHPIWRRRSSARNWGWEMAEPDRLEAAMREALARCPAMAPSLRKVADRVVKSGTLGGRLKLGAGLSQELLTGLGRLLPNAALEVRPTGEVYCRLDRLGVAPAESDAWIGALCAALGVSRDSAAAHRARTDAEAALVLDRCRLAFPELAPIWTTLAESPRALGLSATGEMAERQRNLFCLAEAVRFLLSEHAPLGFAEVGARCFGDSKALKTSPALMRQVEEWLLQLREEESTEESRRRIWSDCGVVDNPTAMKVTLCGPLVYWKGDDRFDWIATLHRRGETATLSWDNVQDITRLEWPPAMPIITCENETPFATLVRQCHAGVLIYTAGYPNPAVRRLLRLLPEEAPPVQHWGDTDLDGLRIAELLSRSHPVQLWRCTLADVLRHRSRALPLAPDRRRRADAFLNEHPAFRFAEELAATIAHGWLEQESWEP
jgi:hypothetical protein